MSKANIYRAKFISEFTNVAMDIKLMAVSVKFIPNVIFCKCGKPN